jgi:lipopolysaccharide export system permease protein
MNKIVPFALFFSFSYVLSRYELNNELIVFWTHGITKLQIINLFLKFSIFLVTVQILLSSFVVPKSQELSRDFLKKSNIDFFDNFIKPKKFNDTIKNLTIYADGKDTQGFLINIYMKKGSFQNFQVTYAKKGKYNFINGVKFLTLYDGNTINNNDSGISNFSFSKSDFNLSDLETNTITTIKTQETSTVELINCIQNFFNGNLQNKNSSAITQNCNLRNLDNVYKELYKRHIIPLYIPILILLSMVHIIRSKEKINFSRYRISIFILGLLTIIFSETTLRFISDNYLLNLNMIIIPILIFLIIYFFVYNELKFKIKKK